MMEETLQRFGEQFKWEPNIEGGEVPKATKYIVVGMGGSHLGAWLIQQYGGVRDIIIHRDYGLPFVSEDFLDGALVILSSYSGTTEEVLDAARVVVERGLPAVVISKGGALIPFAEAHNMPFVRIPDTGLEPRMAIGYAMLGIAHLMGNTVLEENIRAGGRTIDPMVGKVEGARLASLMVNKIPAVYASTANYPLAYIWKIKFNETSKIPAFCDAVPEMCHNELNGYDPVDSTRTLSQGLHVVMLEDASDHPRINKRMRVISDMLRERGLASEHVPLSGDGFAKVFASTLLADWVSLALARTYGVPNPETPMIAEFKHRMDQ
jgi:glucose/mannose-6-phosphate isomerase